MNQKFFKKSTLARVNTVNNMKLMILAKNPINSCMFLQPLSAASVLCVHFRENCIVRTRNTLISVLFLHEELSRQRNLDSFLQDNSGDVQYYVSVDMESHTTSHITESTKMPNNKNSTISRQQVTLVDSLRRNISREESNPKKKNTTIAKPNAGSSGMAMVINSCPPPEISS